MVRQYAPVVWAFLMISVRLAASERSLLQMFPGGQPCMEQGRTMQEGGTCAAFSSYFLQNVDVYANANEQQLQAAVAAGPELTQACCRSLRQYVNAGCACDPTVRQVAPSRGMSLQALDLLAKVIPYTVCNTDAYGSHVSNPCRTA